jgi:DNA mismatch repair protein MutL
MKRIQQLTPLVVNQIAAGEVIERPGSVVKELLENAVDAGSQRIDLEVEQGGIELIRVVDDGQGIHPDDLSLALTSHATSKLRLTEDLFRIATFGFRGEALASIGGVAQVSLQSRRAGLPHGAEVSCKGSQLTPVKPWNGSPGTRIEVRHLFYNTPVRRKFLRTPSTEMGHINEAFTRLALAQALRPSLEEGTDDHPGLHLTLRHNHKPVHDFPASTALLDRLGRFFGPEVSEKLYPITAQQGPAQLAGYVADPSCDRGTTRMQYLFINGRFVRDRSVTHAVQEAYRGLLMTGRHAVVFLFLTLPPAEVDVNVHPTKSEVRFRNPQGLHHLVYATLRQCLREHNLVSRLQVPAHPPTPISEPEASATGTSKPEASATGTSEPEASATGLHNATVLPFSSPPPAQTSASSSSPQPPARPFPTPSAVLAHGTPFRDSSLFPQRPSDKVIQLYDAYLVVETNEGMLVIDQHALHERILFEQLKERIRAGTLETQKMLIPEPVHLTAEQAARTLEHRESLRELGLGVEDFGGGTILLTAYPALLGRRNPVDVLRAVVDHLTTQERLPTREVLFNHLLSLMACHAAVRSGDRLTPEEMSALIRQRDLAQDTHHCPHGRPTALLFSRQELERQFRRA